MTATTSSIPQTNCSVDLTPAPNDNSVYDLIAAIAIISDLRVKTFPGPKAIWDILHSAERYLDKQLALELHFGGEKW
jgi:hypothetical protein